ncbi:MAG: alginate export family protein, partial [Thermodesulfobacteriota bacterium]
MKKFLIAAFAVALIAVWVVPSTAVELSGQLKIKGEWDKNNDFLDGNAAATGSATQQRTRLTATASPTDSTTVKLTIQDTREWGSTGQLTDVTGGNKIDMHEAYIQEDNLFGSDVSIRGGRQVLSYDDQRLVGGFEWSMNARSFDAIKVMYGSDEFDVDAFAAKITEGGTAAGDESDFYGVHATIKTIPNNSLSVYALILKTQGHVAADTTTGLQTVYTFGARLKGEASGVDYTVEIPFQTGTEGLDESTDLSAYAIAARAGYNIPGPNKVR